MRILMLSHGYPPTVSGVTLVVQKLARALVRQGHTVQVVTASERGEPYEDEDCGVRLERIRSFSNPFWSEGPIPWAGRDTLREIIDRFKPDVIHTHENALLSFQLLRLERTAEIAWVSSCYYLPPYITHYLRWGSAIENAIEAAVWKYAVNNLNQYDAVVFSTRTQQEAFIRHGLRVRSQAISNGVDTQRYFPQDGVVEDAERRYALPPRPRVLFVGRLMKDKKIDLLIRAMAVVCAQQPAHLVVIGRGSEQEPLQELASELGLAEYIHLLGYVPEEDLPAIYRACDLFAIASEVEVQSIPSLQAMATGLPVIAVDAAALPELVVPGVNGLLAPPDDPQALGEAILRVVGAPSLAAEMGQASLALVKDHAQEATYRAYEAFYQELLGKERGFNG